MKYRKHRKFAANCACALSKTSDILTLRNFASHRPGADERPNDRPEPTDRLTRQHKTGNQAEILESSNSNAFVTLYILYLLFL